MIVTNIRNTGAYAPKPDVYAGCVVPSKFDVYCLGSVLHEMLVGTVPSQPLQRQSTHVKGLIGKVGALKADLLVGMLEKDQFRRYSLEEAMHHPAFFLRDFDFRALLLFQLSVQQMSQRVMRENGVQCVTRDD